MNRRGLLRGILAAGMAPMVVKAGVLMPVKAPIWVPEMVVGHIESFRFIESPTTAYANGPAPVVTMEMIRRAIASLKRNHVGEPYTVLIHPSREREAMALGFVPVDKYGRQGAPTLREQLLKL